MGDVWKALSDPTGRKILALLKKGDMNAGEIAAEFDMTKPSISNHLIFCCEFSTCIDISRTNTNHLRTL